MMCRFSAFASANDGVGTGASLSLKDSIYNRSNFGYLVLVFLWGGGGGGSNATVIVQANNFCANDRKWQC